eukprot:12561064-Prorocentrum_lima.AAC.1
MSTRRACWSCLWPERERRGGAPGGVTARLSAPSGQRCQDKGGLVGGRTAEEAGGEQPAV